MLQLENTLLVYPNPLLYGPLHCSLRHVKHQAEIRGILFNMNDCHIVLNILYIKITDLEETKGSFARLQNFEVHFCQLRRQQFSTEFDFFYTLFIPRLNFYMVSDEKIVVLLMGF